MPESRHRYLYERLGEHDFQQLVGALLSVRFPDFRPLPLRQADGGRDGVRGTPDNWLVYQVKWSVSGLESDPVKWLAAAIAKESATIRKLASDGVRRYVLVTNVPSTGRARTGTFDRLDAKLSEYSRDFGVELSAMWREAVDPMVDAAPAEVKWAYADMLAGWDLIRYLVSEYAESRRDSSLRELLRRVAATQWTDDERIKFSQAELDRERLTDLFVDVAAERVQEPRRVRGIFRDEDQQTGSLGGAAAYLASKTPYPLSLVRGVPGQGKSTLSQFVCQSFRVAFMPGAMHGDDLLDIKDPRFPIRFDLANYAAWIEGFDVFDESDSASVHKGRRRLAAEATIECFLAELMAHASGSGGVTAADVHGMFERVPALVVMDGLDEVGRAATRKRVVREIDHFCARGKTYAVEPKVIVTTRPNSAGLPEPDLEVFEVISLSPLDHALRDQYLKKWCAVHNVRVNDSRTLRRNFTEKTREPYISELAGNPMQLTILLYLLRQNGDATPTRRTELYDAYMAMLLAREANKHPDSVRKHRTELMEIVPFLGWYIQSRTEEQGHSGRMAYSEVEAAMKHFLRTYSKQESIADELFEAATDRLWALTSKEEGTFEFEVLSLREYFAARFLYQNAGEGDPHFDRTVVFRQLLQRPYWLNTTRFYAGNAMGADIYVLKAGILQELAANSSRQVRVAAWSLITDGVFSSRPMEAAEVVNSLTDDLGSVLLLEALDGREVSQLPDPAHAELAWRRLTDVIASHPSDPGNHMRVRVLRDLLGQRRQFRDWWTERTSAAVGSESELAWLEIGAACEVLAGEPLDIPGLCAGDGHRAQLIVNTGAVPSPGSALEKQLFSAVLDGQCSETTSIRSTVAQVAVALNPSEFVFVGGDLGSARPQHSSPDRRAQAIQLLRKSAPPYARVAGHRRFRSGEKGTTFPWSRTATALRQVAGRCWLATEIAVIGAASPYRDGFSLLPETEAFGPAGEPATLIAQTRWHWQDDQWWFQQRELCTDDLSRAEWAFALWAIAQCGSAPELTDEYEWVVAGLPEDLKRVVGLAQSRLREATRLWQAQMVSQAPRRISPTPHRAHEAALSGKVPGVVTKPRDALAVIARRERWLKVDRVSSYR